MPKLKAKNREEETNFFFFFFRQCHTQYGDFRTSSKFVTEKEPLLVFGSPAALSPLAGPLASSVSGLGSRWWPLPTLEVESSSQFLRWEQALGRGHVTRSQPIRCADQAAGCLEVPGAHLQL